MWGRSEEGVCDRRARLSVLEDIQAATLRIDFLISEQQQPPKRTTNYPSGAARDLLADFTYCRPDEVSAESGAETTERKEVIATSQERTQRGEAGLRSVFTAGPRCRDGERFPD